MKPFIPFVVQSTASMGAYALGLAVSQGVATSLRVSCSTPILGTIGGVAGVGFASFMAGEAAIVSTAAYKAPPKDLASLQKLIPPIDRDRALLNAALGICAFKIVGGSFRTIMPSDLTKVGAIAKESIPAAGMQYAGEEKRRELIRMFRRDGCHHCGTKKGMVIGDHMPPNKHIVQQTEAAVTQLVDSLYRNKAFRLTMDSLGFSPISRSKQRYYPQCAPCSQKQASAVRNNRSHLVFHRILHGGGSGTGWHYVGIWVGAGQNTIQDAKSKSRSYNRYM